MRTVCAALLCSLAAAPGCVVWEIRDEMRAVNTRLDQVDASLAEVNAQLDGVQTTLDDTNVFLESVYGGLGDTNSSLEDMHERLRMLRSIEESLVRLDTHLGSLRRTINRIDGAIPFLSLGGGDEVLDPPAQAPSSDDAPVADAGGTPDEATPARRDPLVGVWMSAGDASPPAITLVLQPDGRFVLVHTYPAKETNPRAPQSRQQGVWTRQGSTLSLTPGAPAENAGIAGDPPAPWTILLQTARSLVIDDGSHVRVLVKP